MSVFVCYNLDMVVLICVRSQQNDIHIVYLFDKNQLETVGKVLGRFMFF